MRALTIKHTYYKVVGWVGIAFFMICTLGSWSAGAGRTSLIFLGFVVLGSYLILNSGSMQVDSDSIRYYLPFRSYQIKWNEVRYIEVDSQVGSMVFVGENKQLAVNGPMAWTGKDKFEIGSFISAQQDKYNIEVRVTEKAPFRLSRNTRVRGLAFEAKCEDQNLATMQDEAELIELQQILAKAWLTGDRAMVERLIAPEWTSTGPDASTTDRASVLAQVFETGVHKIHGLEVDDVKARAFGHSAVVTGRTHGVGEFEGSAYDVVIRFTDTFVRRRGRWQAVASHASLVQEPQ